MLRAADVSSNLQKRKQQDQNAEVKGLSLHEKEKAVLKQLELYPEIIQQAAQQYSPAIIANYTYDLVKTYNSFFQNVSIFGADTEEEILLRTQLSQFVGNVVKSAFGLLGISVPERM